MTKTNIKLLILTLAFAYAIIRYHLFAEVEWAHFPLYTTNKAISFAGVIFLGISLLQSDKASRKEYGFLSMTLITIHIAISMLILNKDYFARFFQEDGTLTLQSEISMLTGILGAMMMYRLVLKPGNGEPSQKHSLRFGWGRMILLLSAIHVAFMGYPTWISPTDWYGYMPPITLLSLIVALAFILLKSIRPTH